MNDRAERFASAGSAFALLARCAGRRERISYADFAFELGLGSPRQLGWLLTPLLDWCRERGLPPLPIIVVRRADGLPSGSYDAKTIESESVRVFEFDWGSVEPPTPAGLARFALPRLPGRLGVGVVLASILALALSLMALPAQAFEQRQVGSWVLKWAEARIGYYCTIETVQQGRTFGYQIVRDRGMFFGFRNPDWNWEPKSMHEAKVEVTDEAEWNGKVISALPDTLVMPVQPNPDLDPAKVMEKGKTLLLTVEGQTTSLKLDGFAEAASAQRACLAQK